MSHCNRFSCAIAGLGLLAVLCQSAVAQFTTIINVPPDPQLWRIESHTQLNLLEDGVINSKLRAGSGTVTDTDLEVNLLGVKSFAAHQRLLRSPERAAKLLSAKLSETATRKVSEAEVSKWIAALGADNQAMRCLSTQRCLSLGSSI